MTAIILREIASLAALATFIAGVALWSGIWTGAL